MLWITVSPPFRRMTYPSFAQRRYVDPEAVGIVRGRKEDVPVYAVAEAVAQPLRRGFGGDDTAWIDRVSENAKAHPANYGGGDRRERKG